jgi:ribonuclease VapC
LTIFVDASALVAIVAEEPGYGVLTDEISLDGKPIWSAISRWETVRALARIKGLSVGDADRIVGEVGRDLLELVPIGAAEVSIALEAHQAYGKGNHPARLNMGDCFAYACAKTNGAKLLYKGDDFSRTDLA